MTRRPETPTPDDIGAMMDDPLAWAERNKAEIAAYEEARARRETRREIVAVILTVGGVLAIASLFI